MGAGSGKDHVETSDNLDRRDDPERKHLGLSALFEPTATSIAVEVAPQVAKLQPVGDVIGHFG
jgi:hypothetical protein